jgi:hypothetical protein
MKPTNTIQSSQTAGNAFKIQVSDFSMNPKDTQTYIGAETQNLHYCMVLDGPKLDMQTLDSNLGQRS